MNFAILGLGSIGLRHAKNILSLGHAVVGFDPNEERRRALVDIGGDAVDDRLHAIKTSDAVLIATPSEYHIADLADAIGENKHVFVEKPLGHKMADLRDLLGQADAKKLKVFAGMNLRLHPAVRQCRTFIEDGTLVDVLWVRAIVSSYLPNWRPHQNYQDGYAAKKNSGGIILDAIHEIDLVSYMFGLPSLKYATSRNSGFLDIQSEDIADILLQHDQQFISNIHMDYVTRPARRYVEIACESGFFVIELLERDFKQFDVNNQIIHHERYTTEWNDDYKAEIQSFIDVIDGKDVDYCDGYEALDILELSLKARDV